MQWDKVKNILLVILLLVDGFLGLTLAGHYYGARQQEKAFVSNISAVLARANVAYNVDGTVPTQSRIMPLEVDRSRAAEEAMAKAVLSGELQMEFSETGELLYIGADGFVRWQADGQVHASLTLVESVPTSEWGFRQSAKRVLDACDIPQRGSTMLVNVEGREVTMTATIAGKPVFGRSLSLRYQENGNVILTGRWTFETPYASTSEQERLYNVADVLLGFVAQHPNVRRIDDITLGYQLILTPSGRLQLVPTWRIETDQGETLVEAGQ